MLGKRRQVPPSLMRRVVVTIERPVEKPPLPVKRIIALVRQPDVHKAAVEDVNSQLSHATG